MFEFNGFYTISFSFRVAGSQRLMLNLLELPQNQSKCHLRYFPSKLKFCVTIYLFQVILALGTSSSLSNNT